MKTNFFLTFFLYLALGNAFAQKFNHAKVDSFMDILERNHKFMGAIILANDSGVIYSKSIGYASIESSKQINLDSKFRIGSVSKMFTAVLVLKAYEQGKLQLNDKLSNYFPKINNARKITIANLLYHRSGIHNFTEDPQYTNHYNSSSITPEKILNSITSYKSDFEPDTKIQYSNSNYFILSLILEKVYKTSYSEILNKEILKPLKLQNTDYGKAIDGSKNECYSYNFQEKWVKQPETNMTLPLGAGAIISTPNNLITFIQALFTEKLLKKSSLDTMLTLKDYFGMGIMLVPFHDKKMYGHGGVIDAFRSMLSYMPEKKLSIAILSNTAEYENLNIISAVLNSYFGYPFQLPEFKYYNPSQAELEAIIGEYSCKTLPIKINVTTDGKKLIAQGSGQPSFQLSATEKNVFVFDQAGIRMEFTPEENKFILKQGGGIYEYLKEKK